MEKRRMNPAAELVADMVLALLLLGMACAFHLCAWACTKLGAYTVTMNYDKDFGMSQGINVPRWVVRNSERVPT